MKPSRILTRSALLALTAAMLALPAAARTLGAGGMLGDVDVVANTVEVGRYTLKVTTRSILRDSHGQRITLRELERMQGSAGVRLLDAHGGYILQELQMLGDAEDDDEEVESVPAKAKPASGAKRSPIKSKRGIR